MGQTLSEPITIKTSDEGSDKRLTYAVSSMQGWRMTMEDSHTIIPTYKDTHASFFAVYDGHGGDLAAKYSGEHLHEILFRSQAFRRHNYRDALKRSYFTIDEQMRRDPLFANDLSGCTAVSALLTEDNVLFVANAGDSRAIISTTKGKAIPLSHDHKPTLKQEHFRITQAGDYVEFGRVNGSLALSRALGDFEFKKNSQLPPEKQAVTADPDITEHELTDYDEFMVIACDGIWDCMTSQEVVDFVRQHLRDRMKIKDICEALLDNCLADEVTNTGIGCDNMTVIIVGFLRKRTLNGWYDWMAKKEPFKAPSLEPHRVHLNSSPQK
ncbi:phosphatase 2C-like domain-containing protein [Phycomyces blakesleeanus]|uniref:protein-serine/threonine phosphatase n=1 Tax=Phycomyces blakesleeanus TaxID=4837 RepID=A0ABR3B3M7_PHYBL